MVRFNVGDKVIVSPSAPDYGVLQKYGFKPNTVYTISAFMNSERDFLWFEELKHYAHQSHFDFYKEEKDMTQQTQQKTKRVPFTHELWESGNKTANVYYLATQRQLCGLVCFEQVNNPYKYAGYAKYNDCIYVCSEDEMSLEIPVTTKRIPFNPELKDAKVFIKRGNCLVKEWHLFSNEAVAVLPKSSRLLSAKDKSELEMEIEEDV